MMKMLEMAALNIISEIESAACRPADRDMFIAKCSPTTNHDNNPCRRFDVVLYCNGMPVSILELKKAGNAHADVGGAHVQLQTDLRGFPILRM